MAEPPPVLLAVFAHPDDEAFRCGGTLALLASQGVRVHVLTATRGGAGSCGDPPICTPGELPAVREGELRCACAVLGVELPRLLDYRDGTLSNVDEQEGADHVLAAVRELHPQALLTWPLDGLSGHPDHVAVSNWSALAFERARAWGADAPAALYHLAVPRSTAEALGLSRLHAVPDEEVTLTVDLRPVWEQKMTAIRCHRTQMGDSPILAAPEDRRRLFLETEHFRRVKARPGMDLLKEIMGHPSEER